jgi:hypothetical protein
MITIRKNGVIILQAKDNENYSPNFETEKDKPSSLFENSNKKEEGLSYGENLH